MSFRPGNLVKNNRNNIAVALNFIFFLLLLILLEGVPGRCQSPVVLATGLLLYSGGLTIRCAAFLHMGNAFIPNVTVRDGGEVRKKGLYRYVRHPGYMGVIMIYAGIALAAGNGAAAFLAVLSSAFVYGRRMNSEERELLRAYGSQYEAYMKSTKKLIPFVF